MTQIEEAKSLLKPLIEKVNDLQKQISQSDNDKMSLQAFYEKQLAELQSENVKLEESVKKYEEKTKILQKELDDLKEQHESLSKTYNDLEAQMQEKEIIMKKEKLDLDDMIQTLKEQLKESEADFTLASEAKNDNNVIKTYRLGRTTEKVKDKFVSLVQEMFKGAKQNDIKNWVLNNMYESANNIQMSVKDRDIIIKRLLQIKKEGKNILEIDNDGLSYSPLNCRDFIKYIVEETF